MDEVDDFAGGDGAGVGDVVDAEGDLFVDAFPAGADKFVEVRDGVAGVEETFVAEEFGEVVAGGIEVGEGDAEAPDVDGGRAAGGGPLEVGSEVGFAVAEGFFAEGFGAGVEGAVVLAEGEVGRIEFGEAEPGSGLGGAVAGEAFISGEDAA